MLRLLLFVTAFSLSPLSHAAVLKTGDAAPDFSLTAADGKTYKLSDFKGKGQTVVLEWFNKDCPYVHKFYDAKVMQKLQEDVTKGGKVAWLTITSSAEGKEGHLTAAEAKKVVADKGMKSTALLLDTKSAVGKMYSAKTTPHMFVIDETGKIAYQGAIDDKPSAAAKSLEGATNYVTAALDALAKKEPVKTPATTPYGCSVKY